MAENEDGTEKTEDASGKKIEDARNKGNLPRSKELSSALLLIVASASLYGTGLLLARDLANVFKFNFLLEREDVFDLARMIFHLYESLVSLIDSMLVLMAVLVVAGIIGSVAIGGFNFTWEPLSPKFSKMNPISGIKRMFSLNSLVELLKSIAKVIVVFVAALLVLNVYLPEVLGLTFQPLEVAMAHSIDIVLWSFIFVSLSLVLIAAVDVPYQAWSHKDKLKMTKQEVKDEYKQQEGDPQIKGRIRQLQRQAAMRRMMSDVPKADVIITNPTHFSVALKYDSSSNGAPILLAKGSDFVAMKIREIGNFHKIPVIQSPALTRAIYRNTEIGDEIPEGLFKAVAQLLAYVFQLKKDQQSGKTTGKLADMDIPEQYRWEGD